MGLPDYNVADHSPVIADEKRLPVYADETGAVPGESFVTGDSTYHKIQRFAARYKIEARGIERVPEDERTDENLHKVGTMVRLVDREEKMSIWRADEMVTSGLLPTWSSLLLLSVRWRYQYSNSASSTRSSPSSLSISWQSPRSASSRRLAHDSAYARWCYRGTTLGSMV